MQLAHLGLPTVRQARGEQSARLLLRTVQLVHEIGHLLGASHERGFVHANEWRDIMSYKANCGGCPRLPVWSNPNVLIRGVPAGSVGHDNARVIAENGLRVAAFR